MKGLRTVDGLALPEKVRGPLRPGEMVRDVRGRMHELPRFFYEVESWEQAKATNLAPHFTLAELTTVDCRENAVLLYEWPHYVPCTISLLALFLESFRARVEGPVWIAANGGYRSPAHCRSAIPDAHCWGTAADICRVGSTWVDSEEAIVKYGGIAEELAGDLLAKPFGHGKGETDDHLHVDLGYVRIYPREVDEALSSTG